MYTIEYNINVICIYIYIHLSLSLYIYIYIHTYVCRRMLHTLSRIVWRKTKVVLVKVVSWIIDYNHIRIYICVTKLMVCVCKKYIIQEAITLIIQETTFTRTTFVLARIVEGLGGDQRDFRQRDCTENRGAIRFAMVWTIFCSALWRTALCQTALWSPPSGGV